jgi:hypothetical protein
VHSVQPTPDEYVPDDVLIEHPPAPLSDEEATARDRLYRFIGDHRLSRLSSAQRDDLHRRSLDNAAIKSHGYFRYAKDSLRQIVRDLEAFAKQEGSDLTLALWRLPGVDARDRSDGRPGFVQYLKPPQGQGTENLAMPVRDVAGRVIGVQLRAPDATLPPGEPRYKWLSSPPDASSGSPVHIARPAAGDYDWKRVGVTEGPIKANIAADRLGYMFVAVPGITIQSGVVPALEALKASGAIGQDVQVLLAYDQEPDKPQVGEERGRLLGRLQKAGYRTGTLEWDRAKGKGIDDALVAGAEIAESAPPFRSVEELRRRINTPNDLQLLLRNIGVLAALPSYGDFLAVANELHDKLGKSLNLNDLKAAWKAARREARTTAQAGAEGLPDICVTNRPLRDVAADAVQALTTANDPPQMFVRSGSLARVVTNEHHQPIIDMVDATSLRWRLARVANFQRATEEGPHHISPPEDVVRDVLAQKAWPFSPLETVTQVPVMRPDGTIVTAPGYDPITRLVYQPAPGLSIPEVPNRPTPADVARAKSLIDEALCDFPWKEPSDRANAWALLLTIPLRPAIEGSVPLAVVMAPKAGTGKGLLAAIGPSIVHGHRPPTMTMPRSEDEMRKQITANLMAGHSAILIDNLAGKFDSPTLCSALTTPLWSDRVLGRSEQLRLPQRAVWIANGNNVTLGGDMPRRCYPIRLDAKVAQPWQRANFRHPDLARWVLGKRGELLSALLTLARSWYAAGCPQPKSAPRPLGSFERWTEVLAGVLAHVEIAGFLSSLPWLSETADVDTPQWAAFLEAWEAKYKTAPKLAADVAREIVTQAAVKSAQEGEKPDAPQRLCDTLPDALADKLDKADKAGGFSRSLGKALAAQEDVRYSDDGLRLERGGSAQGAVLWRVKRDPAPTPASITPAPETQGWVGTTDDRLCETPPNSQTHLPDIEGEAEEREFVSFSVSLPADATSYPPTLANGHRGKSALELRLEELARRGITGDRAVQIALREKGALS